VPTLSTYPVK